MNIAGAVTYDPIGSASATSTGPSNVKELKAPPGTDAMALSVESPAIRVSFDAKKPLGPKHGLRLVGPDHFFAIGKSFRFASAEHGPATVNVVWLRARLPKHGPSS